MGKYYVRILFIFATCMILIFSTCPSSIESANIPIKHIVVIVQENHSFDNYFGTYPGANGLNKSISMPLVKNTDMVIRPYHLDTVAPPDNFCNSPTCARMAYDNGKMDGFAYSEHSSLPLGYFDSRDIPYYWDYASQFVLLDNYFSSVLGDSAPNHLYYLAGQSGSILNDPKKGVTTNITSITDELDKKQISWKFYYGYFKPTQYIESFNIASKLVNVVPEKQFLSDIKNKSLPDVAWITSIQAEHPPQNIVKGEHEVVTMVNAIMQSDYWNSTAIFITWDDWGGWYDHVPPPQVDKFGYGFRVPLMILSPYAQQGFIDHTLADHTSILKFIETVFSLSPLAERDALANNLTEAFDFSQSPIASLILPGQYVPDHYPLEIQSDQTVPEFGQFATFALVIGFVGVTVIKLRKR